VAATDTETTQEGAKEASEEPAGEEAAATDTETTREGAKEASEEPAGDEADVSEGVRKSRTYADALLGGPTEDPAVESWAAATEGESTEGAILITDDVAVVVIPVSSGGEGEQPSPMSGRVHHGDPDELPPMMHRTQVSIQRFAGPDGETAAQVTISAVPDSVADVASEAPEKPSVGGAGYAVLSDRELSVRKLPDSILYEVSTTFGVWSTRESWLANEAAERTVLVKVSLALWDLPRMFESMHAQMKADHGGSVEERGAA
jgi:hypothetical protein